MEKLGNAWSRLHSVTKMVIVLTLFYFFARSFGTR